MQSALKAMGKQAASLVRDGSLIGLGSGSAVAAFVVALGERISKEKIVVSGVPSSIQVEQVASANGIKLEHSSRLMAIDVVVDGADQVDAKYNMIKGGGGAHFREKVMMEASKQKIIVADESKFVENLTRTIPIEVTAYSRDLVEGKLKELGGRPHLRSLEKGYPYFTQNGNLIFETDFGTIENPKELEINLLKVPGIIANGLFTMHIDTFFRARNDGKVDELSP
ncbi:MAG: ribose-5-phosphate isomerase RpiA [Nitrososphaerales archaeon]